MAMKGAAVNEQPRVPEGPRLLYSLECVEEILASLPLASHVYRVLWDCGPSSLYGVA